MSTGKFEWFNEASEAFMRNNEAYLKNDETIEQRVESIAKRAFVDIYPNPDYYDKFIDYMSKGFISLSTPVWSNFGREGTLAIACFNSHVPDTMDGIMYTAAEAGMMSKYGGGTSAYLGEIRPRGSVISKGGTADGPVHFAKLFETVVDVARQGKNRRGSMTITLPVEHPDIKEFLNIRHEGSPIQDLFPSVSITDSWMEEMISGDVEKRNLWADIIRSRQRVGTPFVFFKDNANKVKQDIYKHLDKDINASNLCITGTERVVSSRGYLTAKELYEQGGELTLFDGDKVVQSTEMKLREKNVPTYRVYLENGMSLIATSYHGMAKVVDGRIVNTPLYEISVGDRIAIQTKKGLFGPEDNIHLVNNSELDNSRVPDWIFRSDEKTVRAYIDKVMSTGINIPNSPIINIRYEYDSFAEDFQMLFVNSGMVEEGYNIRLDLADIIIYPVAETADIFSSKVTGIIEYGKEDVFCPTVYSDEHMFVANGMRTFNCQEIMLSSNDDESFVCCLSSLNVEKYDEWKDTDLVEVMTAFLDTVIEDFIETAKDIPFLQRAVNFSHNQRALGLGVLGFASYLQKKNIAFESMEAKLANVEIFSTIQKRSYEESERLGKLLGYAPIYEAEGYNGVKRRNVTTMAIAPTSSSSFILSQTSQGIEPYRSNFYMRNMAKAKIPFKNPHLEKLLEEKGRNTDDIWESIGMNFGSVQHLDFLTEHEKDVFKTFGEISQMEIVNLAAQRQKYIDQGQSLNFLLHPKTPPKELNELMIHAWKTGIKSLYYHHSISSIQEYTNNIACKSCES